MPISFKCPKCSKQYRLKDEMAGKLARCTCGAQLKIPQPAAPAGGDDPVGAGDDPLSSLLDDALNPAAPGGTPGAGDALGSGGATPSPFGAQLPATGIPGNAAGPAGGNPYMAPSSPYQYGAQPMRPRARQGNLPVFCLVMFIIDMVFCGVDLVWGAIVLAQVGAGGVDPRMYGMRLATGILTLLIAAFGISANTLCLMKKPIGAMLGVVTVFLVACSMAIWIVGIVTVLGAPPPEIRQEAREALVLGGILAAGCPILIELIINGLYVAALVKFFKWTKTQ